MIIHENKEIDSIYLQFGVEISQFNDCVKHYAESSTTFEEKLIQKEQEVMNRRWSWLFQVSNFKQIVIKKILVSSTAVAPRVILCCDHVGLSKEKTLS